MFWCKTAPHPYVFFTLGHQTGELLSPGCDIAAPYHTIICLFWWAIQQPSAAQTLGCLGGCWDFGSPNNITWGLYYEWIQRALRYTDLNLGKGDHGYWIMTYYVLWLGICRYSWAWAEVLEFGEKRLALYVPSVYFGSLDSSLIFSRTAPQMRHLHKENAGRSIQILPHYKITP